MAGPFGAMSCVDGITGEIKFHLFDKVISQLNYEADENRGITDVSGARHSGSAIVA